jgi:hypothetical protein
MVSCIQKCALHYRINEEKFKTIGKEDWLLLSEHIKNITQIYGTWIIFYDNIDCIIVGMGSASCSDSSESIAAEGDELDRIVEVQNSN